jgi:hypothetical protein
VNPPCGFPSPLCFSVGLALLGAAFPVGATPERNTADELEQKLAERDAVIAGLLRRVEALERQLGIPTPAAEPQKGLPPPPSRQPDTRSGSAPAPGNGTPADRIQTLEDSSRALERSLVVTGGLLLPQGTFEVQPSIQYSFGRTDSVRAPRDGVPATSTQDVRSDDFTGSLGVRVGLPWTSQLDVSLPFVYSKTQVTFGGAADSSSAAGLGDIQIGLSKQLSRDRDWVPGLIGSVVWKPATASANIVDFVSPTNTAARPISLTTGFDAVALGLTAIKRKDPLVFFGGYSHLFVLSDRRDGTEVSPGDSNGVNFGAILAASPEVSLRGSFGVTYTDPFRLNGLKIE